MPFFLLDLRGHQSKASEKGTGEFWLWESKIEDGAGGRAIRKVGEGSKAQMLRTLFSGAAPIIEHIHLLRCFRLKDVVMN